MKIPATPGLKVSIIIFIRYIPPDRAFVIEAENPLGSPISLVSVIPDSRAGGRDLRDRWAAVLWPVNAPPAPSVGRGR